MHIFHFAPKGYLVCLNDYTDQWSQSGSISENSAFETEWCIWSVNWDELQIFNFASNVILAYT